MTVTEKGQEIALALFVGAARVAASNGTNSSRIRRVVMRAAAF